MGIISESGELLEVVSILANSASRELRQATMTGAKTMKVTPYLMASEVILQTRLSFSADLWSGCTVIEMSTGKPPSSLQDQEVAALFHIDTTKSHPPILGNISQGRQRTSY